jgi:hypothetical protein
MLKGRLIFSLSLLKIDVTFKITIRLKSNNDLSHIDLILILKVF